MRVRISSFALEKDGHSADEYEDAFYPRWTGERVLDRVRVAVADGAAEGSFSRVWARMLVESFHACSSLRAEETFVHAGRKWERWLAGYRERRLLEARPIVWYEEAKLDRGAFATLLGVRLRTRAEADAGVFASIAVGDSCLFQVRGDTLIAAFPVGSSGAFGTAPALVPSRPDGLERAAAHSHRLSGEWRTRDTFFLATDALAAWFLRAAEEERKPWRALSALDSGSGAFSRLVLGLRGERLIRNDDVTLLRLEVA